MRRVSFKPILVPMILALAACESPQPAPAVPSDETLAPAPEVDEIPEGSKPPETPSTPPAPVSLELTADQRAALIQEMTLIEGAMKDLVTALARGQAERAAELGESIHDGFILAKTLDRETLRDLVGRLPDDFRERDRDFHRSGRRLAEAAGAGDFIEAARIHGEMTRACVSCHATYAAERFPALVPAP